MRMIYEVTLNKPYSFEYNNPSFTVSGYVLMDDVYFRHTLWILRLEIYLIVL